MPVVIDACIAAADRLAAVAAAPPDVDPAVAAKRQDLEQLESLAARNPAITSACDALRAEIEAMVRRPVVTPDLVAVIGRISDPAFFADATAEEQRALFGAVLTAVEVGRAGIAHARPRSF